MCSKISIYEFYKFNHRLSHCSSLFVPSGYYLYNSISLILIEFLFYSYINR